VPRTKRECEQGTLISTSLATTAALRPSSLAPPGPSPLYAPSPIPTHPDQAAFFCSRHFGVGVRLRMKLGEGTGGKFRGFRPGWSSDFQYLLAGGLRPRSSWFLYCPCRHCSRTCRRRHLHLQHLLSWHVAIIGDIMGFIESVATLALLWP